MGPASLGGASHTDKLSVSSADGREILGGAVDVLARTGEVRDHEDGAICDWSRMEGLAGVEDTTGFGVEVGSRSVDTVGFVA